MKFCFRTLRFLTLYIFQIEVYYLVKFQFIISFTLSNLYFNTYIILDKSGYEKFNLLESSKFSFCNN
jgi:hypothetical protein